MIKKVIHTLEYIKASPKVIENIDEQYLKLSTQGIDLLIILGNI
jgi:hypothetical protein